LRFSVEIHVLFASERGPSSANSFDSTGVDQQLLSTVSGLTNVSRRFQHGVSR